MAVAGLGLGEYTALAAAGVLSFGDGLRLVQLRAEAVRRASSLQPQAMGFVAGLDRMALEKLCKGAVAADKTPARTRRRRSRSPVGKRLVLPGDGPPSRQDTASSVSSTSSVSGPSSLFGASEKAQDPVCQISNELFKQGFLVSGTRATVAILCEMATGAGALQARVVNSGGAFHSVLMEPAAVELAQALDETLPRMKPPSCPVYFNATGKPVPAGTDPAKFIYMMKKQLTAEVYWRQSMERLVEDGATEFYECGPKKELKALMKHIDKAAWKATENFSV